MRERPKRIRVDQLLSDLPKESKDLKEVFSEHALHVIDRYLADDGHQEIMADVARFVFMGVKPGDLPQEGSRNDRLQEYEGSLHDQLAQCVRRKMFASDDIGWTEQLEEEVKEFLDEKLQNKQWFNYHWNAALYRILGGNPERPQTLLKHLQGKVSEYEIHTADNDFADSELVSYAACLAILSADEVRVPEKGGAQLVFRREHKDVAEPLPDSKNF